jgi:hypothetical protein
MHVASDMPALIDHLIKRRSVDARARIGVPISRPGAMIAQ